MKDMFSLNRIKMTEMLDDVALYIQSVYKQSVQQFTPASPWGQIVMVITKLAQLIFYYIEDSVTELSILTASRPDSIRGLSMLAGHDITRAVSASGTLFLAYNGVIPQMMGDSVIIPNYTKLKCRDNGLDYVAILGQDQIKVNLFGNRSKTYIKILQGIIESQQFTGTGTPIQSYSCIVTNGTNIDNYFVNVYVNGEKWKIYKSLQDMPKNVNCCIVRTGLSGGIDVYFGNGNMGAIPAEGSVILIEYLVTSGELGNIRELSGISFEFLDVGKDIAANDIDLNSIFNIGLATTIGFGANPEPTYLTRLLAPGTSRSYVYANTSNYTQLFERMQLFSYIDVYNKFDESRPWRDLVIYALLLPDIKKRIKSGENYFTVPFEYFKLTELEQAKLYNMLEESGQKILGTIFYFETPVFKRYAINVNLVVWQGYDKDEIRNNIITKLSEYFSNFKRKDLLPKSDLIAIIESIPGIDTVNVFYISEDVEAVLAQLLDVSKIDSVNKTILSDNEKNLLKNRYNDEKNRPNRPVGELSLDEKLKIILTMPGFQRFINLHLDLNGDIIFAKGEIPLMRGGWQNRAGKIYYDLLEKDKLCSLNINFIKETIQDSSAETNKANINVLRS